MLLPQDYFTDVSIFLLVRDNEAVLIEKIASDVSIKLSNFVPSSDFDGLDGMEAHMENMNWFLHLDSNEVKMIGISGPSGIGKSTIARVLFSRHSHHFQLSVFMDNIKRRYQNIRGYDEYSAKVQLQRRFLSQILNHEDIKIDHLGIAQERLKDKRVFVVLDDVDHSIQLEAMAKETGWFGPGSWIIITTQDKKLLNAHGINHIYEVDLPGYREALEIFCMYTFDQKSPYEGFENLVWEVTQLAGKLPLGLRVMGSYLKGRTKEEWKRELPRLRTSLDGEIENILKFSYDALGAEDKDLFLYIACIFNNEEIEKVEAHLANNFSNVSQGLHILAEKSLISVSNCGNIEMHDLLASFGRDIVRKQSSLFLVDARDTCEVLNNNLAGRGSLIGAVINVSEIKDELNKCYNAVESMSSLQFLRLNHNTLKVLEWQYLWMTYLPSILNPYRNTIHILKNLPRKVKLLDWRYFPMSFLPSNFNPEFLVEVKMPYSCLEKLWGGNNTIRHLKWMDLSYSYSLKELPDLSTATNLCELDLSDCSSLRKLPPSIGNAINLQILNLSGCLGLRKLPSSIGNVINLNELYLNGCPRLVDLPSSIGNATNLKKLNLSGCSSLMELPSSIGNVTSLVDLDLSHCSSLVELPSSIGNLHKLSFLLLKGCCNLEAIPININLGSLHARYLVLDLTGCTLLKIFPEISTNIEVPSWSRLALRISYWEHLGKFLNAFECITELYLSDGIIHELNSGYYFVSTHAIWIKELSHLEKLVIKGCKKLVSLPQLSDSLLVIDAQNCESLERLHFSFQNTKFVKLNFANCFKLNQEARNLIIKTWSCDIAILPGEKVPTHFTYRATGSFLSVKPNGIDTHFPIPLRFKACILLVEKGDAEFHSWNSVIVTHRIKGKVNAVNVTCSSDLSTRFKKHLIVFQCKEEKPPRLSNSSSELVFEFQVEYKNLVIEECGIRIW